MLRYLILAFVGPVIAVGGAARLPWQPKHHGRGPSTAFAPTDISGLQLWLKSDAGLFTDDGCTTAATNDGDVVGCWQDQSGNGRNATQATTAAKPTFQNGSGDTVNGKGVIRLDGTDDFLTVAHAAALNGASGYSLFAVVRQTSAAKATGGIIDKDRGVAWGVYFQDTADKIVLSHVGVEALKTGWTLNTWHVFTGRWTGTEAQAWIDGAAGTAVSNSSVPSGTVAVSIGKLHDGFINKGEHAEVLFYNASLSNTDRAKVENYLCSRWSVTCS